jgi:LmbE family N-acetylglucosaminyl deacetylase
VAESRGLRAALRARLWQRLCRNARALTDEELARPALVVAPHPDDESLGCGGTIAAKRAVGAPVTIAILTDGSHSHDRYAQAADMRVRRRREALDAAAALGVAADDVVFVDIEDTRLANDLDAATARLTTLIEQRRPVEVFAPSRYDMPADHRAAFDATLAAVRRTGKRMIVREYPVWLWQHFPWARADLYVGRSRLRRAFAAVRANRRLLGEFRTCCDIAPVLESKRRALAAHASQTVGLPGHERWPTLADVSHGELVACFERDHEIFSTTEVDDG